MSAGSAVGWYDQPSQPKEEHEQDKDHDKDKDKDKGGKHEEKPPPVTVPPAAVTPPPPAVTPPAPVVSQGAPPAPAPEQPVGVETKPSPSVKGEEKVGPTVAQAPSQPALAPAAEREELAKTGIDPGLIALFGAMSLIGGGLLFRRALARG